MRVVSLLPAATEIVAALGALEMLVGVTHECDHPSVVRSRARVTESTLSSGGAATVDREVRQRAAAGEALFTLHERTIGALHPDLVITQALCDVCAVNESDVRALAARLSPPPRVLTLGATTLDGVLDDVRHVGEALHVADDAAELIDGLRLRMRAVHNTLARAAAPRPRVAVIEWTEPVFVAGHWVPDMVRRAGGRDVLGYAGVQSRQFTSADVAAANPEVIVVAPCGYALDRATSDAAALLARAGWEWARERAVWAIDANAFVSRPGPRLTDGVEIMARMFNPALFSPLDDSHARRLTE
jgi:iron complex transport system substrate-binding protein